MPSGERDRELLAGADFISSLVAGGTRELGVAGVCVKAYA
jgi:hypothetical protein